jgi:hypothetical protein
MFFKIPNFLTISSLKGAEIGVTLCNEVGHYPIIVTFLELRQALIFLTCQKI